MTADIEQLPCSVEQELRADAAIIRSWIDVANGPINREALADRLDRYANAAAELTAEIEALRAEVERLRRLVQERDTMLGKRLCAGTNADGKPRCLALAEEHARAERLRAEVAALQRELGALHMHAKQRDQYAVEKAVQALDWKKRAEQLAEALRELVEVFSESGMYDEEVFDKARTELGKEAGRG